MTKCGIVLCVCSIITFTSVLCTVQPPNINHNILTETKSLGDCQSCKVFIESFQNGLERTSRGKYEGGDTAWEEEKLKKSYKRSEMRLVDIQEGVCKDTRHSVQCHHVAEKSEEYIEDWWAQDPDESDDLFTYICIDKLKTCCPKHHFGKNCTPCPGDHNKLCSGNGKCRGDGTRKGNGTCLCDPGYEGENCDQCSIGYFLSFKNENMMLCSICHVSCMDGCTGGTAKDCVACGTGFVSDAEKGCVDINECNDTNKCKDNQFCKNTLGSYACTPCDKSCDGCHGDGPDLCRQCAKDYSKKGDMCIANLPEEDQSEVMAITRFITYMGLLVATGILLPKTPSLGSTVGIIVITYIVGAEYYCMINGHAGLVNLKDFDLMQIFRS